MKYSAADIANWYIWRVNEDAEYGDNITNLKLQKLVYYAQGFHLATFESPLFDDEIRAWLHGPVVPVLYQTYKTYGATPIPTPPGYVPAAVLNGDARDLLEDVYGVYGQFSAWGLRNLTHEEAPWQETPMNEVITHEIMRNYFKEHLARG